MEHEQRDNTCHTVLIYCDNNNLHLLIRNKFESKFNNTEKLITEN